MTSDQAYEIWRTLLNEHIAGQATPQEFEIYINFAQRDYYSELLGKPQRYQPGQFIGPIAYDVSKRVGDGLLPFKQTTTLQVDIDTGIATFPVDYVYFETARFRFFENPDDCDTSPVYVKRWKQVELIPENAWARRTDSEVKGPTLKYPVMRFESLGEFEFSPCNLNLVGFQYLREPLDIFWGRELLNDRFVHDPNDPLNQDPEWKNLDMNEILIKAFKYRGITIREDRVIQVATQLERQGV